MDGGEGMGSRVGFPLLSPLSAVAEWVMEGGDLEEGEEVPTKKTQTSGRFGRGGEVNLYG